MARVGLSAEEERVRRILQSALDCPVDQWDNQSSPGMYDLVAKTPAGDEAAEVVSNKSLIEQVRALIDGITEDPDLSVDAKQFVLRRIVEVETGLREALLTGTPGIEHATDAVIGATRRRSNRRMA